MNPVIKNISFRFTVFDNGWMYPSFWFAPEELSNVISGWAMEYRTFESVAKLIDDIKNLNKIALPNNEHLTSNESHIYIKNKDQVTFDTEYVTGLKPVTIPIDEALNLFEQYKDWLFRYEHCKIPGLIPKSKLESWIVVPRSAVKEEYLKNHQ